MPLPAALLAKLKKRGIVTEEQNKRVEEVEEVFAEDYDDPIKENTAPPVTEQEMETSHDQTKPLVYDVSACPNRYNKYHTCVEYCKKRWGIQKFEPAPSMIKKRDRMLRRYPLPGGWEEVADPLTNRYYYWNTITDQVSWLSPVHPHAHITISAQRIQDLLGDQHLANKEAEGSDEEMETKGSDESDMSSSSSSSSSDSEDEYEKHRRDRGRRHSDNRRRGGKRQKDELDPMDPASYSEVPRGTWSTGLASRGEAKTGADTTASGPLFQQRPYPSPGEILRRNREQP